jgi:hypothetical protein
MKLIITTLLIICCTNLEAQIYKTNHFKIFYTKLDDKNIKEIADSVENNYTRIITNLQSQELPIVSIYFYADTASFRQGVKRWSRNLPIWVIGITLGDSAIHMISPDSPDARNQDYDYQTMIKNTIHEFAHCVTRHINKTINNKPRWLWESIAIYESNQTSDPRQLSYLVNQKPPALSELNGFSSTGIYDVGYFIAEYLVEIKGNDVLNSLIKNNGNIQQTLNMDDEEFTKQWFAFVKKKYGI